MKIIQELKKKHYQSDWYNLRPLLGNANWAMYYILLGSREVGKSYAIMDFFIHDYFENHNPFYWIRLSRDAIDKLKKNNAAGFIDGPLLRKYPQIDLHVVGDVIYNVLERSEPNAKGKTKILKEEPFCFLAAVQEGSKNKGGAQAGTYDSDFLNDPKHHYNICVDEFQKDFKQEKNTFDIVAGFRDTIENIVRSEKERIRIFLVANLLENVSDLLAAFNFLPETWGTYHLVKNKKMLLRYLSELQEAHINHKSRQPIHDKYAKYNFGMRAVIEYIPNTDKYNNRRKGTAAAIIAGDDSNFTNSQDKPNVPLYKGKLIKPTALIKFAPDKSTWFVIWDNKTIARYNNNKIKNIITMRPLADPSVPYLEERAMAVLEQFDYRVFQYRDLVSYKLFVNQLSKFKSQYR